MALISKDVEPLTELSAKIVEIIDVINGLDVGGDADTLDGLDSGDFVQIAGTQTILGDKDFTTLTVGGSVVWHAGNDGATSGLDADLLDGQEGAFYQSAANLNAGILPAARFDDTAHGSRGGGTLHPAVTGSVNGFMLAADKTKLDGVETAATADQTAAEILTALLTVDGAGSLLDADLLDGIEASGFVQTSGINQTIGGQKTFSGQSVHSVGLKTSTTNLGSTTATGITLQSAGIVDIQQPAADADTDPVLRVWHGTTQTAKIFLDGDAEFVDLTVSGKLNHTADINAQTGTAYTLALTDAESVVTMDNAGANTLTIPTNAAVAFAVGTIISVLQKGAGVTTIAGAVGVTLNGVSAGSGDVNGQWEGVSLLKFGTDAWAMSGAHGGVT